ncbi:MAG: hypothetical protein ABI678_23840 [Kofleriaceae bacterium]
MPGGGAKPSLKQRLRLLFAKYGRVAIYTYGTMWILTLSAFAIAIQVGFKSSSTTGILGTLGAAWLAARATTPLRILATIAITSAIARRWPSRRVPPVAIGMHGLIVHAAKAAARDSRARAVGPATQPSAMPASDYEPTDEPKRPIVP